MQYTYRTPLLAKLWKSQTNEEEEEDEEEKEEKVEEEKENLISWVPYYFELLVGLMFLRKC